MTISSDIHWDDRMIEEPRLSHNPMITEDGFFIKHGETADQVTRVGSAADEWPSNTMQEREEPLAQREGRDSGAIAATSKNTRKILSILGTKELLRVKVSCPADTEGTHDPGTIIWKFY